MNAMRFEGTIPGLLVLTLVIGGASSARAELLIDEFVTSQNLILEADGANEAREIVSAPEALGGERDLRALRLSGGGVVGLAVNASGTDEALLWSVGPGTTAEAMIVWDGPDGDPELDPSGLGGIDLTEEGANTALRLILASDLATTLEFGITDASSLAEVSATLEIPGEGGGATPSERFLPLSAFGPSAATVLANVGSIRLYIEGPGSLGLQMNEIAVVVPEPAGAGGAALLALLALSGGLATRSFLPRG